MIVRLVKLTFQSSRVSEFLPLFESVKGKIQQFEGCSQLQLLRDVNNENIFFTYSVWESGEALELYRISPLFRDTWEKTKALFSAPAEAWSLDQMVINS
jgi:autoinducer 2-degrading protein